MLVDYNSINVYIGQFETPNYSKIQGNIGNLEELLRKGGIDLNLLRQL